MALKSTHREPARLPRVARRHSQRLVHQAPGPPRCSPRARHPQRLGLGQVEGSESDDGQNVEEQCHGDQPIHRVPFREEP